jgi:hypothetical protein
VLIWLIYFLFYFAKVHPFAGSSRHRAWDGTRTAAWRGIGRYGHVVSLATLLSRRGEANPGAGARGVIGKYRNQVKLLSVKTDSICVWPSGSRLACTPLQTGLGNAAGLEQTNPFLTRLHRRSGARCGLRPWVPDAGGAQEGNCKVPTSLFRPATARTNGACSPVWITRKFEKSFPRNQ